MRGDGIDNLERLRGYGVREMAGLINRMLLTSQAIPGISTF